MAITRRCVARVKDLASDPMLKVMVGDVPVCLVRVGHEYYAVSDTCSHEQGSLSEGGLFGTEIQCPVHNSTFDARTGEVTGPPAFEDVPTYRVVVEGDNVYIEI